MSAFATNSRRLEGYPEVVTAVGSPDTLDVRLLEWSESAPSPRQSLPFDSAASAIEHIKNSSARLIVLFARYLPETGREALGMARLFQHFEIPAASGLERMQAVGHSFGTHELADGHLAWLHFLSKDILTESGSGGVKIVDNGQLRTAQSQSNTSWIISDYYLHVSRKGAAPHVTLLCLGAPNPVYGRFHHLVANGAWRDVLEQPYILFDVLFEELWLLIDVRAWALADAFRALEYAGLAFAERDRRREQDTQQFLAATDFAGLHNVSKHCIYMREALEGADATIEAMIEAMGAALKAPRTPQEKLTDATKKRLAYHKRLLRSTSLRLSSLEKRISNMMSLSFHLVTQSDNRILRNDSAAMKTIAVMTLIFLPLAGIAAVFDMPFFDVASENGQRKLHVSSDFYVYWALTIPVTLLVVGSWWIWQRGLRGQLARIGLMDRRQKVADSEK